MLRRRRFLATLFAAILPLPGRRARAAGAVSIHLVNGWVLTDRDLAALARLDR